MRFLFSYQTKRKLASYLASYRAKMRKLNLKYQFFQSDLYDFSQSANSWIRVFSVGVIVTALASFLLPLFFVNPKEVLFITSVLEQIVLTGFAGIFFFRTFLETNRLAFLKSRALEAVASFIAFLLALEIFFEDGLIPYSLLQRFGIADPKTLVTTLIQYYLLVLVFIKIIQKVPYIISRNRNPARLVLVSFLGLILLGTFLLMLPVSTVDFNGLEWIDALFMSASAVCVTGLAVIDPATVLSFFGQSVILILIQIGGIGVVTFATFLAMYLTEQLGVGHKHVLQDVVSQDDISAVTKTLRNIVLVTIVLESLGALVYFFSWMEEIPNTKERVFFSVFHAVSAFCNAGFSLFTNSLSDSINATSWDINIVTMSLIILGGLGFNTISELMQKMGKRQGFSVGLSASTKIVLRMTVFLILIGFVFIVWAEWNQVLDSYSWSDKLLIALFQSVTTRTAGFNTIDISALGAGTTLMMIVLMSIGGSPSSTAGGLKTTAVYLLFRAMLANIQGKERVEVFKRTIPNAVIFRAITSLFLALITSFISLIILTMYEPFPFLDLLFEQISAFMTVGLSRGITAQLSSVGKYVIIFSMFIGRVGLLTFAVAFASQASNQAYAYPNENVPVA